VSNLYKSRNANKTNKSIAGGKIMIQAKIHKKIYPFRWPFWSSFLIMLTILLAGCTTLKLNSHWKDRDISINGENKDWLGAVYYFEDNNISAGVLNDDNFIYICMIAEEPLLRTQIMGQGLTIWFDPDGGKEKAFGIKFPLGRQAQPRREMPMRQREEEQDQEKRREFFGKSLEELEILGPKKDETRKMPVKEVKGIEIAVDPSGGLLIYEVKVPLLHSEEHPYAVGAEAGDLVGIGIEVPKMDLSEMRKKMGGRRPEGMGMPGGRRGGMGGMAGGPGGGRPEIPSGLKLWITVQLASDSGSASESLL
jgi:hypothetical protein